MDPVISYTRKDASIMPLTKKSPHDGIYSIYWPSNDFFQPYEVKLIKTGFHFSLPDNLAGIIFTEQDCTENIPQLHIWTNIIHGGSGGELVVVVENKMGFRVMVEKNDPFCNIMFVIIQNNLPKECYTENLVDEFRNLRI